MISFNFSIPILFFLKNDICIKLMFISLRLFSIFMIITICVSCNEKINYSGKIFNEKNFNFNELKNKEEVINKLGSPNYIDLIEKKYYYFSEINSFTNFHKQNISSRTMVVFVFNENESIKLISQYDLNDEQDVEYIKDKTPHELLKRGLIERIFGGVGSATPVTTQ